ncbi:MAG: T9SS type A sorting domain-containing protein [Flavobacteriales bacterium]|nr:T9SS type A sorting domain-containing protein [Flavobacteriales bacterium]
MKNSLLLVSVLIGLSSSAQVKDQKFVSTGVLIPNGMAQVEKVIDGLSGPIGISFDGNNLFVAESWGKKVSYFDIRERDTYPSKNIAIDGLVYPIDVTISSEDGLVVSELGYPVDPPLNPANLVGSAEDDFIASELSVRGNNMGRVIRVNLHELGIGAPFKVVLNNLNTPSGVAANSSGKLYISDFDDNRIISPIMPGFKLPYEKILIDLAGPSDIAFQGDFLYLAERTSGMISRKNILYERDLFGKEILVAKLASPEGIALHGNFLYFSSNTNNFISRIDISNGHTAVVERVALAKESGARLAFFGDVLYFSQKKEGAIYKVLSRHASIGAKDKVSQVLVYPNPANDYLVVDGVELGAQIEIIDMTGAQMLKIEANSRNRIDISHLNSGVYFIRLNENEMLRWIKK